MLSSHMFVLPFFGGYHQSVLSSVVEHGIADPAVTGSIPVAPLFRHGVVGNISACHADTRGSIPRVGGAPLV